MNTPIIPGALNGHAVGIILKEIVRRAMHRIIAKRLVFKAVPKPGRGGEEDFVTDADLEAQAICVKLLTECFPDFGIIAEEMGLRRPCTLPLADAYFTVDSVDGTKAFVRRQSHGVGTMISLVINNKVVCAYVGDINSREIYGYRPGSDSVHRITSEETSERLLINPNLSLKSQHVLLRDPLNRYSPATQGLIGQGLFKSHEIGGGSVGIAFARLWKGEIGAIILHPGQETPWDFSPVLGISEKMGLCFLLINITNGKVERMHLQPSTENLAFFGETLVAHNSRLREVEAAVGSGCNLQE